MATTSSFQKYPDYYNSIEDCNMFVKNYNKEPTNPRYKNFRQVHFTAGDEEQFQKYICNKNGNEIPVEITNDNLFYEQKLFVEWNKYKNIDNLTRFNTFKYIFEKFKKGIYVKIMNNELQVFLPFSNVNFINEWSNQIKIDPKYSDITEFFKYITELEGYNFNKNHINIFTNSWYGNNCLLRYEYPPNEGDTNISTIKNMIDELCKNRKLPDIEFFINRRDFPILSKDGYEPYYHLWNSMTHPLVSHSYDKYLPILSMSSNENFSDILIPTYEDWIRVQNKDNKWFPRARQIYTEDLSTIAWKNKKPTAIFRGSSTGEGVSIETNQRLKLAYLSYITKPDDDNIPYLDAGITKWNLRPKKLMGHKYLQFTDIKSLPFGLVNKLTPYEQSEYKYIIHVDGHVSAFRLSYQLSLNSVILLVNSKWKVWFSDMLQPYVHYVPVKEDLSDLVDQIKWCRNNDKKCSEIVYNSKCFYNIYLQKSGMFDYLQKLLVEVKNSMGIYFNNISTTLDNQITYQHDFLLSKKDINMTKKVEDICIIPHSKRTYPLLSALQQTLNIHSSLKDKLISENIIFSNRLGTIKKIEYIGFNFIVKSSNNTEKLKEHIHESFVGINAINNIIKDVPNFAYIFDAFENVEDKSFNIVSEYISNKTFQAYIMSENFKFTEFLNIMIQICLALEVAQENCCFVHNDLTPWNICLKYLNEPKYIDYKIKNKVISIKTSIIPIIIDYGKSHVIYNNEHYGFINMFKFNKSTDMLSIFITCVYQIITSQSMSKDDFISFLKFTNFISNTKYCSNKFKNSKDIKTFFYSAKKYTNLVNNNKYELEDYTAMDLFNYIINKLNYNSSIRYQDTFTSPMNIGNSGQIVNYIFSSSKEDRIKSFLNYFRSIKKIDLSNIHPLFMINVISMLEKNVMDTFEDFKVFCIKEGVNNMMKYRKKYNDCLDYLQSNNIGKDIYLNIDIKDSYLKLLNINNFDENIFLKIEDIKRQISENKSIEEEINLDELLTLINLKNVIVNILLDSNTKINNKQYINKYSKLLAFDTQNILNRIANIKSLEKHTKILYTENIEKIDWCRSESHKNHYKQLKEILNILG